MRYVVPYTPDTNDKKQAAAGFLSPAAATVHSSIIFYHFVMI